MTVNICAALLKWVYRDGILTLQEKVRYWSSGESVSDYVDKQVLEAGSKWSVSCDGCHTPTPDGTYQAVKIGNRLYRDYPQLGPGSIPRARPTRLRSVASRSSTADFGGEWFDLATARGLYQDETDSEPVVVIGDGTAEVFYMLGISKKSSPVSMPEGSATPAFENP